MAPENLTVAILKEIRDEVRMTNSRLDETNSRLGRVEQGLHNVELGLHELASQQAFIVRWLKAGSRRDRALEMGLAALEARVTALESPKDR